MLCPTCHRGLTPTKFDLAEANVCTRCTGFWFDEPEIAKIAGDALSPSFGDLADPEFHRSSDEAKHCPRCMSEIDIFVQEPMADVTVGGCAACGGLFFHDEALKERHRFRIGTSVDPEAPGEALNIVEDLESQSAHDHESARFVLEWVAKRRAAPDAPRNLSELLVLSSR